MASRAPSLAGSREAELQRQRKHDPRQSCPAYSAEQLCRGPIFESLEGSKYCRTADQLTTCAVATIPLLEMAGSFRLAARRTNDLLHKLRTVSADETIPDDDPI